MEQNRAMTFEDYVSRRIQPVKVLVSMLNKELEEFALASKQKKVSRRSKSPEMNTAYPTEKHPLSQVA